MTGGIALFAVEKILHLFQNMAVVIVFILIGNRLYPSTIHWSKSWRKTVIGLLFGIAGIVSMVMPLYAGAGSIVSMKNIVTALSAWIGGPYSAIVTAVAIVGYRVSLDGIGMNAGIPATITAAGIGLLFFYYRRADRRQSFQILYPVIIGVLVTLDSLAWTWLLPVSNRNEIIHDYALSLFIMFPLAMILFHYFMNVEWSRQESSLMILPVSPIPRCSGLNYRRRSKTNHLFYLTLLNIDGIQTIVTMNSTRVKNCCSRSVGD